MVSKKLHCVLCGRRLIEIQHNPWLCPRCGEKSGKKAELQRVWDRANYYAFSEAFLSAFDLA
jgi:predicted RNA-binding Zn-ribbon protein involved in translation (DUF1610 family)